MTNLSENIYTIDMVTDVLGRKETYVFNIPYCFSDIGGAHYIMFASIISTDDGLTTVTLSPDQEEAIRDDIAVMIRTKENSNAML